MVRYIGILILASSLSAYGSLLSLSLKSSNNLRKEIILLLRNIERCIKFKSCPVTEEIKNCNSPMLKKCGFCECLYRDDNAKAAVNSTLHTLSSKDREMLCEYFSTIGKSRYTEQELKTCRYYIEYFEQTQVQSEKDISTKINLYKKLGLLSGILTAIIFI